MNKEYYMEQNVEKRSLHLQVLLIRAKVWFGSC